MKVGGLDPCEGEGWAPSHTSDASRALRPWLLRRCASVTAHARKSQTDWAARRLQGESKMEQHRCNTRHHNVLLSSVSRAR